MTEQPDPGRVRDRSDFGLELTRLRECRGLTVREVSACAGSPGAHSTIGDWCAGRGLPSPASLPLLRRVLAACGVGDDDMEAWCAAWRRARHAPAPRAGPEPYRGLAVFQPQDREWFFGRAALTARLRERVAALRSTGGGLLLVTGASGAGKSSLLRAGLVAGLREDAVPAAVLVPGTDPEAALRQCLTPEPSVIVVDQAEELFTACGAETRGAFLTALRGTPPTPAAGSPSIGCPPAGPAARYWTAWSRPGSSPSTPTPPSSPTRCCWTRGRDCVAGWTPTGKR